MNRVERFRKQRQLKRRYVLILVLFFMLVAAGIAISDYSVNSVMRDEKRVGVVAVDNKETDFVTINLLGYKLYINTGYIARDFQSLKDGVLKAVGIK